MFDFLSAAQDFIGSVADTVSHAVSSFTGFGGGHHGGGSGKTNPATLQIPNA